MVGNMDLLDRILQQDRYHYHYNGLHGLLYSVPFSQILTQLIMYYTCQFNVSRCVRLACL